MKISTMIFSVLAFCIWQNAYSQLLYPQKEAIDLPTYDKNVNIISPDVEKWMNEELAKNYEKKYVEMKTDVKGRIKKDQGIAINGTEYKKVAVPKQKRKVVVSDMHIQEIDIEPAYARYEYNAETKNHNYYFNGKKMSEKEYLDIIEKRNKKFDSQKKGKRNLSIPGVISSSDDRNWIAFITAEEISELIKNYKELAIDDYIEPIAMSVIDKFKISPNVDSILTSLQLSTHAFPNNYKGNGIGIYVAEPDCINTSIPIVDSSKYTNKCTGAVDAHHSWVVNVLQYAAPMAHIFGSKASATHPSNPFSSYSPPLEIGTHSYGYPSINNALYNSYDASMDNYIYNNRVISFVAAGNNQDNYPTYLVASPGKALNAITVGAVRRTNEYDSSSCWINSDVGNDKPEMAMYTGINMGSYSSHFSFTGTSAATPLAAGFLTTLISQHPFCKRQPAMMKASLINAEKIPIANANTWDTDNNSKTVAKGIVNYYTAAWGTAGVWWDGGNSAFFNSNNEITMTESNVQANKRYKIAIAWLTTGSYVSQNKKVAQDLDLYVYQNGKLIAYSVSYNNPFEAVDFVAPSSDPLTIIICRFRNSGNERVILGYNINYNH